VPLDSATANTVLRALRRLLRTLLLMRYHSNELALPQPRRRRRRRRALAVSWQLRGDDVACCVACYPSHAREPLQTGMHASQRKLSSKPFAQNSQQGKLRLQHPFHDGFVGCPSCHPTNSVKALKAAAKLRIIHASCNKMIRDVNSSSLGTRRRDLRAPAAGARHWLSIDIC